MEHKQQEITTILTHPGGAHKDEFLACSVLASIHGCPIVRREPSPEDLADPRIAVVDVGGEHAPEKSNFDHHQLDPSSEPICALSLVLQHLDLYADAREFCDWLETLEHFDVTGPNETAAWLGVDRRVIFQLASPLEMNLIGRFSRLDRLDPDAPFYDTVREIGRDLLSYIRGQRERLGYLAEHSEIWEIDGAKVFFVPRLEPALEEPSAGISHYLKKQNLSGEVVALVYPDRRSSGYSLTRHRDNPRFNFTRLTGQSDVHFAHVRGFVAKTTATEQARLRELLRLAEENAPVQA